MTTSSRLRKRNQAVATALALLLATCVIVLPAAAQSKPTPKELPFAPGEELVYGAEFTRSLIRGADVAEFHFRVEQEQITPKGAPPDDPVTVLRLTGDVVSKGFFTHLFGVHFHEQMISTVDAERFTVLESDKTEEQDKRARKSEAIFDGETHRLTWTEHNLKDPTQPNRVVATEFTEPVQDAISGIYFLRTQPLAVGKTYDFQISDSGRVVLIHAKVTERKKMDTAIGSVNCFRIEPNLFGDQGLVQRRGTFVVWISDDHRRIPVRAQVKVDAGTFDIKLKRPTNAR
jgi:hypothetical protein